MANDFEFDFVVNWCLVGRGIFLHKDGRILDHKIYVGEKMGTPENRAYSMAYDYVQENVQFFLDCKIILVKNPL